MAKGSIKVTAKITKRIDGDSSLLAYASITINDSFVVYGVKLIEKQDGTQFVAMPSNSYEKKNGRKTETKYADICFPCTKEARKAITEAVFEAYDSEE